MATHQKKLCLINVSEMFLSGTVRDEASSLVDGIHPGIMQSKLLLHILKIISYNNNDFIEFICHSLLQVDI